MKITFLSPAVNLSGGVKVLLIHAAELTRLGHDVTIVSQPRLSPSLRDQLRSLKNKGGLIFPPRVKIPDGVRHIELDSLRSVANRDVPDSDFLVATWWETAEWAADLTPSKGRRVYFIQGHEVYPPIPSRSRDTYKLPFKKVVVSEWLKRIMESLYGDTAVSLVPNTVDRTQFCSPQRERQVVPTVGLLYSTAYPKGLDVALTAINLAQKKIGRIRVKSFGTQRPTRSHPLPFGARFIKTPPPDQLLNLYCGCDVWLSASRNEGFNLTALEAMACRVPVVATATGWPADGIVNGFNGILCDVDNAEQLAKGLATVLCADDRTWKLMCEAAYRTMTTRTWAESTKLFERALETA